MTNLKEAIYEEAAKVFTAFITWGIGVLFMIAYCAFIYWLNENFSIYVVIIGAMSFLAVVFFFVDLWWSYSKGKGIRE